MLRMSVEVVRVEVDVESGEESHPRGRVVGYADADVGGFRLKHLKVVQTGTGRFIVEYPARPRRVRCGQCDGKHAVNAQFCPRCGSKACGRDIGKPGVDEYREFFALTHDAHRALETAVLVAWAGALSDQLRERRENYRYTEELLASPDKYREEHLAYRSVTGGPEYGIYGRKAV